jgi:Xaa-Pro dipeptidase
MENAAENSSRVFDFIGKHMRAGDTDVEISSRAELFARSIGHGAGLRIRDYQKSGLLLSHVSAAGMETGKGIDFPSLREGNCLVIEPRKRMNREDPVTLESRFFLNGYHVNEARIFSIGPPDPPFEDKAEDLMALQQEILAEIKPGVRAGQLFNISREKAVALGIGPNNQPQGTNPSWMIGNGIGLELLEPPLIADGSRQVLKPGMVLSLFSEKSLKDHYCLRIKDVVLVTETGSRTITRLSPQTFIVQ